MKSTFFRVLAASILLLPIYAQENGYILKWHPSKVAPEDRRSWVDNQLARAGLPPLTGAEVESLKTDWNSAIFDGCSGNFSAAAIAAFEATDDIAWVEPDYTAQINAITTQTNAPWGLQRISQRSVIEDGNPRASNFVYTFDDSAGEGVDIYVIDTGVRVTHNEFGGRATFARSFGSGVPGQDIQGHGTHCAGIAASSEHGVAKKANVIAVKVMRDDGTGSASNIISGINFVVQQAVLSNRPSVINLSVTTPASRAVDSAVSNAVSFGIHVVVAAGNDNVDASLLSPARADAVITVGATDINDQRASFSNFGPDVDIWAPGVEIISLGITSNNALKTLDGTSMATPFVAGLVAYFLGLEGPMSPLSMKQKLRSLTTNGIITGLTSNSTNVLAFNDAASTTVADPAVLQQQSVLGAVDGLISAFAALANAASGASSQ